MEGDNVGTRQRPPNPQPDRTAAPSSVGTGSGSPRGGSSRPVPQSAWLAWVMMCLTLKSSKVAHIHPGLLHTQGHTVRHTEFQPATANTHRTDLSKGNMCTGCSRTHTPSLQTLGTKLPRARCHPKASLAGARGRVPLPRALLSPAAVIAAVFIQTRRGVAEKDFEE